jgi:hypothetical protein
MWHTGRAAQFHSAAAQSGAATVFDGWDFAGIGSTGMVGSVRTRHSGQVWYRHRRTELLGQNARR